MSESFFRNHPEGTFSVLIVDDYRDYIDPEEESFEVIDIGDIGIENFQEMLSIYELLELTTAVKPWLLSTLLDRGYEEVIYLDPDIQIFESLDDVAEASRKHGIVLTPHVTEPMPQDGKQPDELYILRAGTFNLGFIGVGQGNDTDKFLSWWQDHLTTECLAAPEDGYFVDQKWLDFVPSLYPQSEALFDHTLNVAYWNLPTRKLTRVDDDYLVNGNPLRFFHFSGFDPSKPHLLSKFQDRIILSDEPALRKICNEYSDKLYEFGYEESCKWKYTYSTLPNGASFEGRLKLLHIKAMEEGETFGDLFTSKGVEQFFEWLNEPASRGASFGVTRYLHDIYVSRRDLQERFPDLDDPDGSGLIKWAIEYGVDDENMHVDLIPEMDQDTLNDKKSKEIVTSWTGGKRGVNVAGYFSAELGVGQAGRATVSALEAGNIPITTTILKRTDNRQDHEFVSRGGDWNSRYAVNIICANADQTEIIAGDLGVEKLSCGYTIGIWFWEVEQFPDQWPDAFKLVDEIWAASDHAAKAIADVSPKPVVRVRLPIIVETRDFLARDELGIKDGFTFLSIFDFRSVVERKNPFGLISAYTEAFSEKDGPKLLIKTINGDKDVEGMERLQCMVAERSDIEILDGYQSQQELDSLIATCDCYVSLHRAEGLGLTMGEAMYLGKPVIATGYSGNMEFMNNENSYLVDYDIVRIGDGSKPYPPEGKWAEPDIKHAVELMREVYKNPQNARTKGGIAAEQIRKLHSPEAAGQVMLKRLQTITSWKSIWPEELCRKDGMEDLVNRVSAGPNLPANQGGKIKRMAKRSSLGLTKPYSNYQQGINSRVVDRLRDIDSVSKGLDDQLKNHGDELKIHDDQLQSHKDVVTSEIARLDDLVDRVQTADESLKKIIWENEAIPYMSDGDSIITKDKNGTEMLGYEGNKRGSERRGTYVGFEDTFRGSESFIKSRQEFYIPYVQGYAKVIEAGCGRGEFLDILREQKIEAVGVDSDQDMVKRCKDKGHQKIYKTEINRYLKKQDDASIPLIYSAQLIEHLTSDALMNFLNLSYKKLEFGGRLIAETVNPHSPPAMKTFWTDLTHVHPIFPEVALVLAREIGFESARIVFPNGAGVLAEDRFTQGDYSIIADK